MFLYVESGGFMVVLSVSKRSELYTLNECSLCYSLIKLLKKKTGKSVFCSVCFFHTEQLYFLFFMLMTLKPTGFSQKQMHIIANMLGYFQLYPTSSLNSQCPGSKLLMPPPNRKQTFLFCISEDGDITQARNLDSSSHLISHLYPLSVNSCLCSDLSSIPAFSCPVTLLEFLNT